MMINRYTISSFIAMLLIFVSCNSQNNSNEPIETTVEEPVPDASVKNEPHRYGGWYCPDNFGFVPVDVQKLDEVPAIINQLPTQQELDDNMSLINIDTVKYPNAKALEMNLPRVARIYSKGKDMEELIIVIQAIVIQKDTIVGYRFANGGNGSTWMSDVTFLSEDEVADMGAQPFYYSKSVLNSSTKNIWNAISKTDYFKKLGEKFDEQNFFSSEWSSESHVNLNLNKEGEKATGYVGMVYGNYYLQIDYVRDGFHYSEKMLMKENQENNTTEFFFASGPYPENFEKRKLELDNWIESVIKTSEER